MRALVLLCINHHTIFNCLASPIWLRAKFKTGSCDPDHVHYIQGILSPKSSTWCIIPPRTIWRLSLQPSRRYDYGHQNWKWVMMLPWPRPF